jgi:hypothetical protein
MSMAVSHACKNIVAEMLAGYPQYLQKTCCFNLTREAPESRRQLALSKWLYGRVIHEAQQYHAVRELKAATRLIPLTGKRF